MNEQGNAMETFFFPTKLQKLGRERRARRARKVRAWTRQTRGPGGAWEASEVAPKKAVTLFRPLPQQLHVSISLRKFSPERPWIKNTQQHHWQCQPKRSKLK